MLEQLLKSLVLVIVSSPIFAGFTYLMTYSVLKYKPNFLKLNIAVFVTSLILVPLDFAMPAGTSQLPEMTPLLWMFVIVSLIIGRYLFKWAMLRPDGTKLTFKENLKVTIAGFIVLLVILIFVSVILLTDF
jgi:hypothetical protein